MSDSLANRRCPPDPAWKWVDVADERNLKSDGSRRCLCCSEAEAAAWLNEVAEAALMGNEDRNFPLPDVCNHYLGFAILHGRMGRQAFMRIVEALNGELIE